MSVDVANGYWPQRIAGVIAEEKGLILVLKELLRKYSWVLAPACDNVSALLKLRNSEGVGCFIVIDSPNLPATETLRELYKHPRARLTPTIVICGTLGNIDQIIFEKIFHVTTCTEPLTSSTFKSSFVKMKTYWDQPVLQALRKVAAMPEHDSIPQKIEILDRLLLHPNSMPLALSALTTIQFAQGDLKGAEARLLDQCKLHPKNPAMLAFCAWFYLAAKMPAHAARFLQKLKTIAPTSVLLNLDYASAQIACGELTPAITATHEWLRRNQGNLLAAENLARLLVADGRIDQAEQYGISKTSVQKILNHWEGIESPPAKTQNPPLNGLKAS